MLVITLRTVTFIVVCRRYSTATISSVVVPCAASRSCSQPRAGVTAGSWSRSRLSSATAKGTSSGRSS